MDMDSGWTEPTCASTLRPVWLYRLLTPGEYIGLTRPHSNECQCLPLKDYPTSIVHGLIEMGGALMLSAAALLTSLEVRDMSYQTAINGLVMNVDVQVVCLSSIYS